MSDSQSSSKITSTALQKMLVRSFAIAKFPTELGKYISESLKEPGDVFFPNPGYTYSELIWQFWKTFQKEYAVAGKENISPKIVTDLCILTVNHLVNIVQSPWYKNHKEKTKITFQLTEETSLDCTVGSWYGYTLHLGDSGKLLFSPDFHSWGKEDSFRQAILEVLLGEDYDA